MYDSSNISKIQDYNVHLPGEEYLADPFGENPEGPLGFEHFMDKEGLAENIDEFNSQKDSFENFDHFHIPSVEETKQEFMFNELAKPQKEVQADEPAVVLAEAEPVPSPEVLASTQENTRSHDSVTESVDQASQQEDEETPLVTMIEENFAKFSERQSRIDAGTFVRTGPGRNRRHGHRTSSELLSLVVAYLRKHIAKIVSNRRCKDRKDALITIYIRALKKLSYYLVEQTAAKNMYKRNETSKFLVSFSEAHASFLFSIGSPEDIVKSFCEFVVIYFPEAKAREILDALKRQGYNDHAFLEKQHQILKKRDNTSKKNIKVWADNSLVLRQILTAAYQILQEPKFARSKAGDHLIQCTRHFLGMEGGF